MVSTIAQGTVIKGRVSGDGDLEVHGHIEGSVEVAGDLSVGSTGLVKSDLRGRRVAVAGAVKGDLIASDALVLEAGARVVGDLVAPSIAVREGALVRGRITTGEPGAAKAREPARAAASTGRERASAPARPALRQESPRPSRPVASAAAKPPAAPPPAAAAVAAPAAQAAPKPAAETPRAVPAKQAPPPPVVPALKRRTEKVKRKGS